jgi:hypothetical protein
VGLSLTVKQLGRKLITYLHPVLTQNSSGALNGFKARHTTWPLWCTLEMCKIGMMHGQTVETAQASVNCAVLGILFRIMELCRIFTILSFFAFLFDANNHSITPYSPTKQVSWQLTCGLNLVAHNHIPGHNEDLHPRPHISMVKNLGAFIVLVTVLTWHRNYYFNLGILLICNKNSVWPKYNHSEIH